MNEVIFNDTKLKERLLYWQRKLRLQDWIIDAKIVRQRDMSQPDRVGEISSSIHNKVALISILDPIDYDDWGKQDMESTLVHELLHLHFSGISYHFGNDDNVYHVMEEQAIESITSGLISSERK